MRSILLLAALFTALPCGAILTRADRDDAEYLELANRYPAAIVLGPGIEGTLIAPRWVLTSASAVMLLQGAKLRPPLQIGGKANAIQATFRHPDWNMGTHSDIALVLLAEAVTTIEPAMLSGDRDEIDEVAYLVGHGDTGRIGEAARRNDGKKRAAINTIDRVLDRTLAVRVKAADEASDLQGALTVSERGAPLFTDAMAQRLVTGVYSGDEGSWQVFARVSSFTKWIADTMFKAAVEEASRPARAK